MGFFSWNTSDTKKSIPSHYTDKTLVPVTMKDDRGNAWFEDMYEGYGEFGGKDYYELVDEMNGGSGDRDRGIKLCHPPTLCDPKQYGKNAKINILQDDGEYKAHTIADYNRIIQEFLDAMPEVVKVPILVEDATIGWSAEGRPEVCKYQGYWY